MQNALETSESQLLLPSLQNSGRDDQNENPNNISLNQSGRDKSPPTRMLTVEDEENMEPIAIRASDELYLMLRCYCLMVEFFY